MKKTKHSALRVSFRLAALFVWTAAAGYTYADDQLFQIADAAARDGRLVEMQSAYERKLSSNPNSIRALRGRATALAWQGKFEAAEEGYRRVLEIQPSNLDAITGLGYVYAWRGDYSRAHTEFRRALRIDPENGDARKGVAYSYYWAGDNELALGSFEMASSIAGPDPEIAEATGRVYLAQGHNRNALENFRTALALDPSRKSARSALRIANTSGPLFEVDTRLGATSDAGSGLRGIEVSHWLAPETRLSARYDNSLSLDNSFLADRGEDVPGYFASVQQQIAERWIASVEYGRRDHLAGNESVVSIQGAYSAALGVIRTGARFGRHEAGHTDRQLFTAFNFAVGERWRFEPALYVSESGVLDDSELRGVLHAEYQSGSFWKAGAFAGFGEIDSADSAFDGGVQVVGLWGDIFVADRHSLRLSLRREDTPTSDFSIVELGFTFRIPGN